MAGFQNYEIDNESKKNQTKNKMAGHNREKISMEEIKKVQFILLAKQFLFYSAFFDHVDKRLTGDKEKEVKDVEKGAVDLSKEPKRMLFYSDAWNKLYDGQDKKYFGKTSAQWTDIFLVILLITVLVTMFALVTYVGYVKDAPISDNKKNN